MKKVQVSRSFLDIPYCVRLDITREFYVYGIPMNRNFVVTEYFGYFNTDKYVYTIIRLTLLGPEVFS